MKLLNVGCGGNRPGEPWTNLDCLREILKPGTPERINLDNEPNYVECNFLTKGSLPFTFDEFDGVLCSHVIEHFSARDAVSVLSDCRRILKPGGLLVVSVPDAAYFLDVYSQDTPENAVKLFGEPISEPWHNKFFDYALFKEDHMQVLTWPALTCLLVKAGFPPHSVRSLRMEPGAMSMTAVESEIRKILNRQKFSVILKAIKSA